MYIMSGNCCQSPNKAQRQFLHHFFIISIGWHIQTRHIMYVVKNKGARLFQRYCQWQSVQCLSKKGMVFMALYMLAEKLWHMSSQTTWLVFTGTQAITTADQFNQIRQSAKHEPTLMLRQNKRYLSFLSLFQVTDFDGFFEWADADLIHGLYQGDTTPVPMSFLIGGVRLRQLRVRHGRLLCCY